MYSRGEGTVEPKIELFDLVFENNCLSNSDSNLPSWISLTLMDLSSLKRDDSSTDKSKLIPGVLPKLLLLGG